MNLKPAFLISDAACDLGLGLFGNAKPSLLISDAACDLGCGFGLRLRLCELEARFVH